MADDLDSGLYLEETPKSPSKVVHCPLCNGPMHIIKWHDTKFYGCNAYPNCLGRKDKVEETIKKKIKK